MLLLDTCTFVWLISDQGRLSSAAMQGIRTNPASLYLSSISAFEIGLSVGKGKLRLPQPPEVWIQMALRLHGIRELPVTWQIAIRATQLPRLHNDPFDRIIVATAQHHGMPLVTPDHLIRAYSGTTVMW